jgi:ketosteroid isomerase-like protein
MSEENVEIVRRCYGFLTDRDFSAVAELAHPDVVIDLTRNVFNPATYRGLDGVRRWVEGVDEIWDDFQMEPEELIDAGDKVFAVVRLSGKGRGSGIEADMGVFGIWTLREGKVSRLTGGYRDRAEALEAAGLSE